MKDIKYWAWTHPCVIPVGTVLPHTIGSAAQTLSALRRSLCRHRDKSAIPDPSFQTRYSGGFGLRGSSGRRCNFLLNR